METLKPHRKADPPSELNEEEGKGDDMGNYWLYALPLQYAIAACMRRVWHYSDEPEDYKACSQLNHG